MSVPIAMYTQLGAALIAEAAKNERLQRELNELHEKARIDAISTDRNIRMLETKVFYLNEEVKEYATMLGITKKEEPEVDSEHCCAICTRPYTESGSACPRLLECGHTLCERCCDGTSEGYFDLKCPFDRHSTILDDSLVKGLPINYAILESMKK